MKLIKLTTITIILLLLTGCVETMLLAGASGGALLVNDRRTSATIIEDQNIELKAKQKFISAKDILKETHVSIISFNNIVLILGQVQDQAIKTQIGKMILSISKVRRINNELTISSNTTLPKRAHDTWITAQVKTRLLAKKDLASGAFKIITENGTVYLMGLVGRKEAEKAVHIARTTRGVKKVIPIFEYLSVANK